MNLEQQYQEVKNRISDLEFNGITDSNSEEYLALLHEAQKLNLEIILEESFEDDLERYTEDWG